MDDSSCANSENVLMDRIEKMISNKLACFEERISQSQKDVADSQICKMQEDILCNDTYQFKRKSCENQFKFNLKETTQLREAESHVRKMDIEASGASIAKGMDLMMQRQKPDADASEMGWAVVKEYFSNPLASDSEDEKQISRAENKASKKAKQFLKTRPGRGRFASRFVPYTSRASASPPPPYGTGAPIPTVTQAALTGPKPQRPGLCFGCGRPGHWKFECRAGETPKTYDKISRIVDDIVSQNKFENFDQQKQLLNLPNVDGVQVEKDLVTPVGRLKRCIAEWDKIGVTSCRLKLKPNAEILKNNKSAKDNSDFVENEIEKLLSKGCISEIGQVPQVVNPLIVAFGKKGKPRMTNVHGCHKKRHMVGIFVVYGNKLYTCYRRKNMSTRFLHACIDSRLGWNSMVLLSSNAIKELEFCRQNARNLNVKGDCIASEVQSDIDCFTDASQFGYGCYVAL
ncbi:hypothetical protein MAR_013036, partial [Mya arenaria]